MYLPGCASLEAKKPNAIDPNIPGVPLKKRSNNDDNNNNNNNNNNDNNNNLLPSKLKQICKEF